jgi:hypothetical protein
MKTYTRFCERFERNALDIHKGENVFRTKFVDINGVHITCFVQFSSSPMTYEIITQQNESSRIVKLILCFLTGRDASAALEIQ